MDKKAFFVLLAEKLLDRNLEEDQILKQIRHFDHYFSRFTPDEVAQEIESLGDPDILADNIIQLLKEKENKNTPVQEKNDSTDNKPDDEELTEIEEIIDEIPVENVAENNGDDIINADNDKTDDKNNTVEIDSIEGNRNDEEDIYDDAATKVIDAVKFSPHNNDIVDDDDIFEDENFQDQDKADTIRMDAVKITKEIEKDYDQLHMIIDAHSDTRETIIPESMSDKKILGMNNKTLFWVVLIVTLPISVVLLSLFFGLFALGFIVLASVMCLFFILLAGAAAGGTGLCLFGIIYGAGQTAACVPIGVYEIGFAVIIAGISVLLGVLFYNAAMILMPRVLKRFYHFFINTVKNGWKFFVRIKRECEQS